MKNKKIKHWTTKSLVLYGKYLCDNNEYGYGLLCMQGAYWGLKISTQLGLKWKDFINSDGTSKKMLEIRGDALKRPIYTTLQKLNLIVYREHGCPPLNEYVYVLKRSKKVIDTSNLNKDLQRHAKRFEEFLYGNYKIKIDWVPIKSNAFQIAWALDMVKVNSYSKASFKIVGKILGQPTISKTAQLLGVSPKDDVIIRFDLLDFEIKNDFEKVFYKERVAYPDFSINIEFADILKD